MSRHGGDVLTPQRQDSHAELVERLRATQKHSVGAPAWSRYVNRPVGRHLAAIASRAGLRPDQVTGLSALASLTAIVLLVLLGPSWPLGAAVAGLLVLGYALDSADGQLARLQGSSSPAGEWLDHVVDSAKIVSLHAAVLLQLQRWDGLVGAWSLVPLAFLVVDGDAFNDPGFDCLDAIEFVDARVIGETGVAMLTQIGGGFRTGLRITKVAVATIWTHAGADGAELGAGADLIR